MERAPEIAELKAWAAIALVQMGQEREAMTLFETAFRADPGLVELLPRVAALGLVQVDPAYWSRSLPCRQGEGSLLTVPR